MISMLDNIYRIIDEYMYIIPICWNGRKILVLHEHLLAYLVGDNLWDTGVRVCQPDIYFYRTYMGEGACQPDIFTKYRLGCEL